METLLAKLARETGSNKLASNEPASNQQRRTHHAKQVAYKAIAAWSRRSLDYTQPSEHAASDRNWEGSPAGVEQVHGNELWRTSLVN
jgi:hypothetical protein